MIAASPAADNAIFLLLVFVGIAFVIWNEGQD